LPSFFPLPLTGANAKFRAQLDAQDERNR
jgi:hypothetical protein